MSSGSYFPPPVRIHGIPKKDGGTRELGIPTVADRIAQMVVKAVLEPKVEPVFSTESYGYRPGKSALAAVGKARERCWKFDWVIDLDIRKFFDSLDHDLMMETLKRYVEEKWIILYIERWLKCPGQDSDGDLRQRERGTPQGGVISPLLANIFLHHAFDEWMQQQFPTLVFERYADDVIVHCKTEKQSRFVLWQIQERLKKWKLELHSEKTKIVYCKDARRTDTYKDIRFTFLGYTFQPRAAKNKTGRIFTSFIPAISNEAAKEIRYEIRKWKLTSQTQLSIKEIAVKINPVIRGWVNYYGAFYKSALIKILRQLELSLVVWAMRKHKKLHRKFVRTTRWLRAIYEREPSLFAHWSLRPCNNRTVRAV